MGQNSAAGQKITVVMCAYTLDRWDDMVAGIGALKAQTVIPDQIVLIIDHNTPLFERSKTQFPDVTIIENDEMRGLSGARNSGLKVVTGDIIAFIDEDAVADPDWIEKLLTHFADPQVMGAGGSIEPWWVKGKPRWFPEEFNWVVGCTYRGMPTVSAPIRNLIGCNMAFRREVFDGVGGFIDGIGRVGTRPVGCEETELCIRARQHWPGRNFIYEPAARVKHRVPPQRANWKYFRSRCYAEGISKALVAMLVGAGDGLSSERSYTMKTLPFGVLRGLRDLIFRFDLSGFGRASAIVIGLLFTTTGYIIGNFSEKKPADRKIPSRAG